jgi:hypothetical protein
MRYFVILGIVAFLSGCTADSYQLLRTGNVSIKLEPSKSVYISISRDGRYGQINYQGSGANASQIILMAFSKNSNSAETARQYQSFDNALTYAKENNYGYLVFPTILEWEDRATVWSGIPDKASIKIAIVLFVFTALDGDYTLCLLEPKQPDKADCGDGYIKR